MKTFVTKMILLAALGAGAWIPSASADALNQKTVITFNAPVEIPGQVLPAGTYVFKLANASSNRQIVRVFNQEENHVFGTFLTIPDYRLEPAEKTIIRFHERPAGQPEAIKAWFYPGKNYGHAFVYRKSEARVLAEANHVPVPAMPAQLEQEIAQPMLVLNPPEIRMMTLGPLLVEQPNGQEVQFAEAPAPEKASVSEASEELPNELPATATSMPLLAALGAIALLAAVMLRLSARMKTRV